MKIVFKFCVIFLLIFLAGNGYIYAQTPCDPYPSTVEKGCNCADNVDNDGDGKTDILDADCASYYGLTFVSDGTSNCSIMPPDSTGTFSFVGPPTTTPQNTVDTQSKTIIADMDGDGIPEVVATSKWNKSVRIIATNGPDAGTIVDEFGTTGGDDIFPKGAYTYELELAVGDIDHDGYGEIFVLASARKTPNDPPSEYYFVALTYKNGTLQPLYDAIDIGPNKPGMIELADFDHDGLVEVYIKNRIYAAETGKLLAQGTGNWNTEIGSAPVAADVLTGTTNLELVCGGIIYDVPNMPNRNPATPATLTVAKSLNSLGLDQVYPKTMFDATEYGTCTFSSTSVADMNGDGNLDVVISGALGSSAGPTSVFFWDVANNKVSHFEPPDPLYPVGGWPWGTGRPNLCDLDGDGDMDINFIAGNKLWALTLDASGNLVPLWATPRTINDSKSGILATTVYDFNNDGHPELVYRDSQQLVIVDGATGQNVEWATSCQSHTMTEGPIIADANGDGSTDIVVPCNTSNSFDINAQIQQQALGQVRMFYSSANNWLPTRKVWNQAGYFVVNVNDDVTIPENQFKTTTVFGTSPCSNGIPGPIRPFNTFLNQVPTIGTDGCPFYPAPDVSFIGDNPNALPGDSDYVDPTDPNYFPTVEVIPPVCGDLAIKVRFNIINNGALPINASLPVSFWDGDPTVDPVPATPATLLHTENISLTSFDIGDTLTTPYYQFNSTGKTFRLYIVLNDDGTVLPAGTNASTGTLQMCNLGTKSYYFDITPEPFQVYINKIQDDIKCADSAADNGELKAVIIKDSVEVTDYSNFAFQWYDGIGTASPIGAPAGTGNAITGLDTGFYSLVVTNTDKGCASVPIDTNIVRIGVDPDITIIEDNPQTKCSPPDGQLHVEIAGGNTGFVFTWYDRFLNPLGIVGSVAGNLTAGEYIVSVDKDGCSKTASYTLGGPVFPIVQTQVLQNVVDCSNLQSGEVTATAFLSGVAQDSSVYTFNWYEADYDSASGIFTLGSTLAASHGTGPTRWNLPAGYYGVTALDENTGCESDPPSYTQITTQTLYPDLTTSVVAPQTSCDPTNPNGKLKVDIYVSGVLQDPANFTIQWFKGDNTLPANLISNVSGVNGEIANGIAESHLPYTVKVTTANNCSNTTVDTTMTENLVNPVVTGTTTDNTICDPVLAGIPYNGSVTTTPTYGGAAISDYSDFTFVWYDGQDPSVDPVIPNTSPNGDVLDGLDAGRYTVILTKNSTSCESTPVIFEIFNTQILPTINLAATPATNCIGGTPNGSTSASVDESGTPVITGYTFKWFKGTDTSPAGRPVTAVSGTANETANQQYGDSTYTIYVVNSSTGCSNTKSLIVVNNSAQPVISLSQSPNTICDPVVAGVPYDGAVSGSVTYNGSPVSAFAGYIFKLFNGQDTTSLKSTINAAAPVFNQLDTGYFTMRGYISSLGCYSDPVNIKVQDNFVYPVISIIERGATNCDPAKPNGQFTALGDGTTTGKLFKWVQGTNLAIAKYNPTSPSGIDNIASQLVKGTTYSVKVTTSSTGCFSSLSRIVSDSSEVPVISLSQTPNTICDPAVAGIPYDGTLTGTVTVNYGTSPVVNFSNYVFKIFEGNNDTTAANLYATKTGVAPNFTQVDSGYFTMRGYLGSLGCYTNPVTIKVQSNFVLPVISLTEKGATNCDPGIPNGMLTALGDGTTTGKLFKWVPGTDTSVVKWTNLSPGGVENIASKLKAGDTYTVKVTTQATGCYAILPRTVSDSSAVPLITLSQTPNTICDPAVAGVSYDGTLTGDVTYRGGPVTDFTDYTFKIFEGNNDTSAVNLFSTITAATPGFTQVDSGYFTMRGYLAGTGCYSNPVTLKVQSNFILPVISLTEKGATNCDPNLPNGMLTALGDGVTAGKFFKWVHGTDTLAAKWTSVSPVGVENIASLLTAGETYTVKVTTQANGCYSILSRVLSDSSAVPVITLSQTPNSICDPAVAGIAFDGTITGNTTYRGNPETDFSNYSFKIFNSQDTTTSLISRPLNISVPPDFTYSELDSGYYTVRAYIPSLGCYSNPVTLKVQSNYTLPVVTVTEEGVTSCDPANPNGRLTAFGDGVTSNKLFKWVDGTDTTAAEWGNVSPGGVDNIASGLSAGATYTVKVTEQTTGCLKTQSVLVSDVSQLPQVTLAQSPNTLCDPALNGGFYNGKITPDVTYNGSTPSFTNYSFKLFDGTDTTGAVVTTMNGTMPLFTDLAHQFYTFRAYNDSLACYSDPKTIEVQDNLYTPAINIVSTDQTSCDPAQPNGAIQAQVDAGGGSFTLTDYTFNWYINKNNTSGAPDSIETDGLISKLKGNIFYTVEVVGDTTGCNNSQSVFLSETITIPVVTSNVDNDLTICTTPDGQLSANVGGLTAGFTFYWLDSASTDEDYIKTNSDFSATDNGIYTGLVPGRYSVVAFDNSNFCLSLPDTTHVADLTEQIKIDINIAAYPATCGLSDGALDGTVDESVLTPPGPVGTTAGYDFEWYRGSPVATNPPSTFFSIPPIAFDSLALVSAPSISGITSGNYTIVVTRQSTGCKELRTFPLPFSNAHEVDASTTGNDQCDLTLADGKFSSSVTLKVGAAPTLDQRDYTFYLIKGSNPDTVGNLLEKITPVADAPVNFTSDLEPGIYNVWVKENVTGNGCFAPAIVDTVDQLALPPVLTNTVTDNTNCDPSTPNGELDLSADKDPADLAPATTYSFNVANQSGGASPADQNGIGAGVNTPFPSLDSALYKVTVTADLSGCTLIKNLRIRLEPTQPQIIDTAFVDQNLCKASGSAQIVDILPGPIGNYSVDWYLSQDSLDSKLVLVAGSTLLDNGNYANMGAGDYYAVATNNNPLSQGFGCETFPVRFNILDISVDPVIAFTTTSNQSCDPATIANGTIDIAVTKGSGSLNTFDFNWTNSPGPTVPADVAGGVPNQNYLGREPGGYSIKVTDTNSACFVTGTITVADNPLIPVVQDADIVTIDQDVCKPAGSVTVNDITLNGASDGTVKYTFAWYDGVSNLNTLTEVAPAVPGAALNAGNYPTIGAGSYYFIVRKTDITDPVGYGCKSAPYEADINNTAVDPSLDFVTTANQSCDPVTIANGTIGVTVNPGSGSTGVFDYTWTAYPGGVNPGDVAGGGNTQNYSGQLPGLFTVEVQDNTSLCKVTGSVTVPDNPLIPVVQDADISVSDQNVCKPDGSVTVNDVLINGASDGTGSYSFEWYRGLSDLNTLTQIAPPVAGPAINVVNYPTIGASTYYFIATKTDVTDPVGYGCKTSPYDAVIADTHVDPSLAFTSSSNQSCDPATIANGSISVTVTAGSSTSNLFDYTWTSFPPAGSPGGTWPDAVAQNYTALIAGLYSVDIQDTNSKCKATGAVNVNDNPVIPVVQKVDINTTDQMICAPDGSITVNNIYVGSTADGTGKYTFEWYDGANNLNSTTAIPGITGPIVNVLNYTTIHHGSYFFIATKDIDITDPVGYGCSTSPYEADIADKHTDPTLVMSQTANRTCDLAFANGTITALASTGAATASSYGYTWTSFPSVTPGDRAAGTNNETWTNIVPGIFSMTLKDNDSKCTISGGVTVSDNPAVPYVQNADITINPLTVCGPGGDITVNRIFVNSVSEVTGNYQFTWFNGSDSLNNNLQINNGAPVISGPALNTGNYSTIGAGSYYFEVTRSTGTPTAGEGCKSSPYEAIISDEHVDPSLKITKTANQNCDLSFANGSLTAVATTNGVPTPTYSFILSSSVLATPWDSLNIANTVLFGGLKPGDYSLVVTDDNTACKGSAAISIEDKPAHIDNQGATVVVKDQLICAPDGSITVTAIQESGVNQPLADYDANWYISEADLNTDNFLAGTPQLYLDTSDYASIGMGTYYFKLIKSTGTTAAGEGCTSAPLREDIMDKSIDPYANFTLTSNSSCDLARPNGALLATAFEFDSTDTDTYSFIWTFNGSALPAGVTQFDSANTSKLNDAADGSYNVLVTNTSRTQCVTTVGTQLKLDQSISVPNIIKAIPVDPVFCYPTGSITVTEIEVGGKPANVSDFDYIWYDDQFQASDIINDSTGNPVLTAKLSGQLPGRYFVTARNLETSCNSDPKEVHITDGKIVYPVVNIQKLSSQTSCDPNRPNAALASTVDGGNTDSNSNYSFTWYTGLDATGTAIGNTSTIYGLGSGEYSVSVMNIATGCASDKYYITKDEIEKYRPVVSVAASPRLSCRVDDGSITAQVLNVPGNFEFDWYKGLTINNTPDFIGSVIDSLPEGTYSVTARDTDSTYCVSLPGIVNIDDQRIYPDILVNEDNPLTNCYNTKPNAQLSASIDGKIGGYTIEWFNGTDTTGVPDFVGNTYEKLLAQTYTVVVINDVTGCVSSKPFAVNDNTVKPPVPQPEVVKDLESCIDPDGALTASVNGDVLNYMFEWTDGSAPKDPSDFTGVNYAGLTDGTYTVTARDIITGCLSDGVQVSIADNRKLPDYTFVMVPEKCEQSDGSLELAFKNTLPVASMIWTDAETGNQIDEGAGLYNYPAGKYDVTVTTTFGCQTTLEGEIKTEIFEFNGVSPNGDGKNDNFEIACISKFPNNLVKIFNRSGQLVYQAHHYDNAENSFKGIGFDGIYLRGTELPDGTYFYVIDKGDGSQPIVGYLELFR